MIVKIIIIYKEQMMKHKISVEKIENIIEDKLNIKFDALKDAKGFVERKQTEEMAIDESDEFCILAKISSPAIDRDGEILDPEGCDYNDFLKNSVCFINHDYSQLPIAKVEQIQTNNKGVYAKIKFGSTDRCKEVFTLIKEGILRANSVGFFAKEIHENGTKEFSQYLQSKFAQHIGSKGSIKRIISKWVLLENSIVGLPSNPDALIEYVSAKGMSEELKKELNIKSNEKEPTKEDVKVEEKTLEPSSQIVETEQVVTDTVIETKEDIVTTETIETKENINEKENKEQTEGQTNPPPVQEILANHETTIEKTEPVVRYIRLIQEPLDVLIEKKLRKIKGKLI